MCRLFASLSTHSGGTAFLLKDAPQSLLVQSAIRPKRLQADGWGVGWFKGLKPIIHKSPYPLYKEHERLLDACETVEGRTMIGHVRWASNPLKLPKHELIAPAHTQPFTYGPWLFAHNGTLLIPREVSEALGSWRSFVKGQNDSEVLFFWLMKTVVASCGERPNAFAKGLRQSFKALDKIWQACKKRYPLFKHPYHGVNWVLTNGQVLYAFCYVNGGGFDKGKAFCNTQQPYYQMQVFKTPTQLLVASEPLFLEPGWQPMQHGELLVGRQGQRIVVGRQIIFN